MGNGTKTRIVKIGNSQGIRIPKPLLDQADFGEEVELEVRDGQLIVRQAREPRFDWDDKFAEMAAKGDDRLLDQESITTTSWDMDEWEW